MPTIAALRSRWTDPEAAAAGLRVLLGLTTDGPFGLEEGRIDLRGLAWTAEAMHRVGVGPAPWGELRHGGAAYSFAGAQWQGLDLRHAPLGQQFWSTCRLRDCRLDGANLSESTLWACRIESSTLVRTNLSAISLLPRSDGDRSSRSELVDCDLSRARLARAILFGARITGCVLDDVNAAGARLDHCRVAQSSLRRMKLGSGQIINAADAGLRPGTEPQWLIEVDLRDADLAGAWVWHCQLKDVTFSDGTLVVDGADQVAPVALEILDRLQARDGDTMLRTELEPYVRSASPDMSIVVPAGRWEHLGMPAYAERVWTVLGEAADRVGATISPRTSAE